MGVRSGAVGRPAPELHPGDAVLLGIDSTWHMEQVEELDGYLQSRGVTPIIVPGQHLAVLGVIRGPRYAEVGGE